MLKSLKKIENPAARAITAALTAGAIATMVSMDSIKEDLKQWGVEDKRFHSESFGKGSKAPLVVEQMHQAEIVFSRSMKTLTWTEKDGTILEFAEANNVNPPYSCRAE